jgi:hypothetical protein
LFVFFCKFVNGLNERYPEIFEGGGASTQHQVNFGKKWGGYATIVEIANNDILKFDFVTDLPLEKCLLYLAYKSDKVELENLLHREALKRQQQS